MSFVAAIWMVLLHVSGSVAALPVQPLAEVARARVEAPRVGRGDHAFRVPQAPAEAIGATRDARTLAVARSGGRVPIGSAPAAPHGAVTSRSFAVAVTGRVLRVMGEETHRLASRGSLLPFFPTAPPFPG